ncbi:hypothetical protein PMIN06_001287 [Paraphaeosphaeria minitans]
MMQNVPVPNGVAPGTFETAEALTSLTTIGVGQQHHPPRRTSILVDPNHTELHSIVTPGRLRGTIYFEAAAATMAQDNLGKFLSTIQQDPARAAVVRSVKLDQFYDNFENSELAEVFNEEIWPTYAFTDENSDEIYPPVLNAALYMKGIQRRAVNDPIISQDPLCPTDLTRLDKVFLAARPHKPARGAHRPYYHALSQLAGDSTSGSLVPARQHPLPSRSLEQVEGRPQLGAGNQGACPGRPRFRSPWQEEQLVRLPYPALDGSGCLSRHCQEWIRGMALPAARHFTCG